MLAVEFVRWWYGAGYRQLLHGVMSRTHRLALIFSLPLLIRTLGSPWRRIISYSSGSLGDRFRAFLDNLVSRAVGLVVRCLVIVVAVLAMAITGLVGALLALVWPLLPLAGPALFIWGVV